MRLEADFLRDMLRAIELIAVWLTDAGGAPMPNTVTADAILRRLTILGEAAKQLSNDVRVGSPEVPWRQMAGLRDVLVHQYWRINYSMLWTSIAADLPPMRAAIEQILAGMEDSP